MPKPMALPAIIPVIAAIDGWCLGGGAELAYAAIVAGLEQEHFVRECLPDLLREVLDHVTESRIREFMDESIEDATSRVREYRASFSGRS